MSGSLAGVAVSQIVPEMRNGEFLVVFLSNKRNGNVRLILKRIGFKRTL